MENKIQELTKKLLEEGVQKGEQRAQEIIAAAQKREQEIIAAAQASAEKIVSDARQKAEELRRNIESEIKLASAQAISAIKEQIINLCTAKALDESISMALSDPETIKALIVAVAQKWQSSGQGEQTQLEILLSEDRRAEFEKAFKGKVLDILSKGMTIQFSKNIKGGFQIGPKDGSFKISLTDEDFKSFFKEYLRPKTKAFLFGQ